MSHSSPSLFDSLQRFAYKKKTSLEHGFTSSALDENQMEAVTDESSNNTTFASQESVIRPVMLNIKTYSGLNSEEPRSVDVQSGSSEQPKHTTPAHTISDSEDDSQDISQQSTVVEDDDDDVIIVPNVRSRTPRPIIVSDDDDDFSNSYNSTINTTPEDQNRPSVIQNGTSLIKTPLQQEGEVFIVDDDSNSVEMVVPPDATETPKENIIRIKQETDDLNATIQLKEENNTEPQQNGKRKAVNSQQNKVKRKRKKKNADSESDGEGEKGGRVFDSDADSDEEISDILTESKRKVLDFMNTATEGELRLVPSCTAKKIVNIMKARPFEGWIDLVTKCQTGKFMGTGMLNGAQTVIEAREAVSQLMRRCERIATRTESAINAGALSISQQPSILNPELKLMPYQMVGLNWLNVMNSQNLSGILADEMGLGKTIQVIAFLAHLKETGQTQPNSPHLIVVPSSTLENWSVEFEKWCPSLKVEQYYGSPDERRYLRSEWFKNGFTDIDVLLTTYNMVGSCYEEKKMFRVVNLHFVVFDEAHMLKNMNTQRYANLITINALHRVLLTGTPLQNNLLELMSLLVFVMPDIFSGKTENLKFLFSKNSKQNMADAPLFEQEQVQRAKQIMRPFFLRRLKSEVLNDLPTKTTEVVRCDMEEEQAVQYEEICDNARNAEGDQVNSMTIMMDLRRMANHPLTLRYHYEEDTLNKLAELLAREPDYKETDPVRVLEDIQWMSDHQIHNLVKTYKCLAGYELSDSLLVKSGKFLKLDEMLPTLKSEGHRVLIFSQFIFILDLLEDYMRIWNHKYLRLDGQTPVTERQDMIDEYNQDPSVFVFLLTTKAGGIGINLTAADTVIIHDVDFNPYNDKQAEDRCHRMGQTRPVRIMRFVSKGTIEEAILKVAEDKLHLEKEVTSFEDDREAEKVNVAQLLRETLGISGPS